MCKVFLTTFLIVLLSAANCWAGPVYVYKQADGTTRFSSKPPPAGMQAKVFTAQSSKFSYYRMGKKWGSHLFRSKYKSIIASAARKHKVEEPLIRAVIHSESAFNPQAVSPKGAQGLMQLMPQRARQLGVKNPFSPYENVLGGTRHLAFLIRKYNGNLKLALAAYNAGENAVERYGGVPPYKETTHYVQRVLSLKSRYAQG